MPDWLDPAASHLAREIREQPDVIEALLTDSDAIARAARKIRARHVSHVLLAARGSSDNAARFGQYLIGGRLGLPAALATPSLQTMYGVPTVARGAETLSIGISQSGRSPDIVAVLDGARRAGALTLAITNDAASPLAGAAEVVIELCAGPERSVAATKTYTASLAALAALVVTLAGDPAEAAALSRVPALVGEAIERSFSAVPGLDERLGRPHLVAVGRGFNLATAYEFALKLRELSGAIGEAFSPPDLLHGPIAAVGPRTTAVLVAPAGRTRDSVLDVLPALAERGADPLIIGEGPDAELPLPAGVPEWLSPIVAIVPGQVAALRRAVLAGASVDAPAGLSKVTRTL
jgi:glucosamine--fructose-6-phosphate aminotransferase (isomerizing)